MTSSNSADETDNFEVELLEGFNATVIHELLYLKLAIHYLPLRWRGRMRRLIQAVEQGATLEIAIEQLRSKLPGEFYSIVKSSLQLPEPGKFVLQAFNTRWEKERLLRNLTAIVAYPMALLLAAILIACAASLMLAPALVSMTEEFGLSGASSQTVMDQRSASLGMFSLFIWCGCTWLALKWIGPRWASLSVLGGLPYVGKAFRWISLYEIVQRLESVTQQGLSGIAASERVADSLANTPVEATFSHISRRIKSGVPLGASMAQSLLGDGLCGPVLLSLDYPTEGRPDFGHAAQVLWRLLEIRLNTLATVFPFLVFMLIVNILVGTISTYLGLLVQLIRILSAF